MNRSRAATVWLWAAVALGPILAVTPAAAQSSVKVVVNDQPITSYQIAQRARLIQLTSRQANATNLATQELIDDALRLGEASRMKVVVSKEEVDAAFATIAERVKMKPDQLAKALSHSGVDPGTLKARLKAQIAWGKVVRQRFSKQVNVAEQDVIAALQAKGGDHDRKTTEYDVTQIIFVVPGNAKAGDVARRQKEAEALRGRFTSCSDSISFAKSLPEVVVRPVGKRLQSDLTEEMTKLLDSTAVGRLTPPQQTPAGFEMLAVCNKRVLDSDAAARQVVEDEMMNTEGELVGRRYLRDVKSNAIIEYR